jgi:hypothetical protein
MAENVFNLQGDYSASEGNPILLAWAKIAGDYLFVCDRDTR